MVGEAFSFSHRDTVGSVLLRLSEADEDFARYRGQHPYIVDDDYRLIGVVFLRTLLTARRTMPLTEIMVEPLSVTTDTRLDELEDLLDEHPFLGLPVVDADGWLARCRARRSPTLPSSGLKARA